MTMKVFIGIWDLLVAGGATVVVQPRETEIRELDEIPGRGAEFHIKPNHVNTQQYVRAI